MVDRVLRGLAFLSCSVFVYYIVVPPVLSHFFHLSVASPSPIQLSVLVVVFSVSHAVYSLGWRHALAFFSLSVVISWLLEQIGVATGTIYGGYHYTDLLGARLGHVPVLIPLSWFEYVYCSYIAVNCILLGRPIGTRVRAGWIGVLGWMVVLVLATAALTTAQDLVIDPIMSGKLFRAWVWETPGGYYDVPSRNFLGWLVTASLVVMLYRIFELWRPPRPRGRLSRPMITLPLLVYGTNVLVSTASFAPPGLSVIGAFVLGPPVLLALGRVWLPNPGAGEVNAT